jgi:hypothetical protein
MSTSLEWEEKFVDLQAKYEKINKDLLKALFEKQNLQVLKIFNNIFQDSSISVFLDYRRLYTNNVTR